MDESGAERPRIKISPRESKVRIPTGVNLAPPNESIRVVENAGLPFWNALSPEIQAVIETPIRRVEESIARQFPNDFVSPMVAKARSLRDEDNLERQHDLTSCTYVSTANALRVLDQPRPEYGRAALANKITELLGSPKPTIDIKEIESLFASVAPYDQFSLPELTVPKSRFAGTSPEMAKLFHHLAQGDVAVAAWRQSPTRNVGTHGEGFITHARTIAGFSKGPDNTLQLHVVDPYGARQEIWDFRDWIAAMGMDTLFDNPGYTPDDIKVWMQTIHRASGFLSAMTLKATNQRKDVFLIHKKRPSIVIKK